MNERITFDVNIHRGGPELGVSFVLPKDAEEKARGLITLE
jgi:hypothetical protein